jgi:hypothetical protein
MAKKKSANVDVFDEIVEDMPSATEVSDIVELVPDYASSQWSEYVMSKFNSDELEEGKPKVVGLRRLTETLLGGIHRSVPTNVSFSEGRAIVVWEVQLENGKSFGGTADATSANVNDETFAPFLIAMAEVRAEVRALKRALQITVVGAEEIVKRVSSSVEVAKVENTRISDIQIKFLTSKCKALNIVVDKLTNVSDVTSLTRDEAARLIALINDYQSGKVSVPEELKG